MIEVTVTGLPALRKKLKDLQNALNVTEILDESEAILLNRIRARFLAETDPDNKPWRKSKAALVEGRATLFKTGTLFHSIQAFKRGVDERAIGTDVFYARFHQFGKGPMLRPFLGFNGEDLTIIEFRVVQRIKEALA